MYKVGTFDYIHTSVEEINRKNLILRIPFQLLRLRKKLIRNRDENTIEELKSILINDMLELEVDKIIDETTRKVTAEVTEKVTESNIKGMIEILSSAGFDKNEITEYL